MAGALTRPAQPAHTACRMRYQFRREKKKKGKKGRQNDVSKRRGGPYTRKRDIPLERRGCVFDKIQFGVRKVWSRDQHTPEDFLFQCNRGPRRTTEESGNARETYAMLHKSYGKCRLLSETVIFNGYSGSRCDGHCGDRDGQLVLFRAVFSNTVFPQKGVYVTI